MVEYMKLSIVTTDPEEVESKIVKAAQQFFVSSGGKNPDVIKCGVKCYGVVHSIYSPKGVIVLLDELETEQATCLITHSSLLAKSNYKTSPAIVSTKASIIG